MNYAAVCDNRVILTMEARERPVFPPTIDGREVSTVEIYQDENVCIGMTYTEEEGFKGECPKEPKPEPPKPTTVHISREDFDLLDVTYKSVTYYIEETDGTITMKRGEE